MAASVLEVILCLAAHAPWWIQLGAAVSLLISSYVAGFCMQTFRERLFPPLTNLQRRQYAHAWDALAESKEQAFAAAAGQSDESRLRRSAGVTVQNIMELAVVTLHDDILEVGCGVGRIGRELSPHCRSWTGTDISANMLRYAADRLRGIDNVRLVRLEGVGLPEFQNTSFDVVYFTNMMMHLDEMDRWFYLQEAFRVLRTEGRVFFDNIDLESDAGWAMFANDAKRYRHLERPPYMPRLSTAWELRAYASRAGFANVTSHQRSPVVIVTAVKPGLHSENDSPA
jgi:SAM-dependent methyltransferase